MKIISPGRGSSGYYPAAVLERDGPQVFKKGTLMYFNHATASEAAQRPEGDYNNLAAVTIEGLQDDDYPYSRSGRYGMTTYLCNAKSGTLWLWMHPEVGTAGLRAALGSTDGQQRFRSAWLLAMREDAATAEPVCRELIPWLREKNRTLAAWSIQALFRFGAPARPWVEAALPGEDARQAACLWLLLRDWDDPPRDRYEAARRWHLPLSYRYHDPAWEPALAAPGRLPDPFAGAEEWGR